jgi:hypothetical protein
MIPRKIEMLLIATFLVTEINPKKCTLRPCMWNDIILSSMYFIFNLNTR